jgi:hypothetical protein
MGAEIHVAPGVRGPDRAIQCIKDTKIGHSAGLEFFSGTTNSPGEEPWSRRRDGFIACARES